MLGSAGTASASTVVCTGAVEPLNKKKPGVDAKLDFTCSEEIRGFGVTTNKTFDFFGTELEVLGPDGVPQQQSATIQCEGNVPGPGFGCGSTNRASAQPPGTGACEAIGTTGTAPDQSNTFGPPCNNRVDPGDTAELQVGFPQNPCKPTGQYAPGKDKLRIWAERADRALDRGLQRQFRPAGQHLVHPRHLHLGAVQDQERIQVRRRRRPSDGKSKGKKAAAAAGSDPIGLRIW